MDKIEKMVKTDVAPRVHILLVRDESQKASATFVGHNKAKMKNIFPWSSAIVPSFLPYRSVRLSSYPSMVRTGPSVTRQIQ